jgi:hypothetical protein
MPTLQFVTKKCQQVNKDSELGGENVRQWKRKRGCQDQGTQLIAKWVREVKQLPSWEVRTPPTIMSHRTLVYSKQCFCSVRCEHALNTLFGPSVIELHVLVRLGAPSRCVTVYPFVRR